MSKRISVALFFAFFMVMQTIPAIALDAKEELPKEIRIGLTPTMGKDVTKYFEPFTEHLKNTLGVEVKVLTAEDYDGILKGIRSKQIDFARLGAKSYVDAKKDFNVEALVAEVMPDGEPGYFGAIIAKKGSGIENMEQAKGKVFAFADLESTSGFLAPSLMFARDLKIEPKTYFKEIRVSGSHANSIMGVKDGSIDVAAISELTLSRLAAKGVSRDDFVILRRTELIPGSCIASRADIPKSLKNAVKTALLAFNANKEGLKKMDIGGYKEADDKMYDVVREMERLNKELSRKK